MNLLLSLTTKKVNSFPWCFRNVCLCLLIKLEKDLSLFVVLIVLHKKRGHRTLSGLSVAVCHPEMSHQYGHYTDKTCRWKAPPPLICVHMLLPLTIFLLKHDTLRLKQLRNQFLKLVVIVAVMGAQVQWKAVKAAFSFTDRARHLLTSSDFIFTLRWFVWKLGILEQYNIYLMNVTLQACAFFFLAMTRLRIEAFYIYCDLLI